MPIDVRRADDRYRTEIEGRATAHSFAFGEHYDPRNLGFGPLIAHNDELLAPGAGYDEHLHRDTEIVTWVLSGALRHTDNLGHSSVVLPGQVQVLSAGSGVVHAETNAVETPTRFIQTWLRPDRVALEPRYSVETATLTDGWTVLAGPGGIAINVSGAALYLGRIDSGSLVLPEAPRLHLFVLEGAINLGEREIRTGSAARLMGEGGRVIESSEADATVLVWALPEA